MSCVDVKLATIPNADFVCVGQVLIAESYGGRDEPVDTLTNNFVGVGVEPVFEAVRVRDEPNEATYQVDTV